MGLTAFLNLCIKTKSQEGGTSDLRRHNRVLADQFIENPQGGHLECSNVT